MSPPPAGPTADPTVTLGEGTLRGRRRRGSGGEVAEFLGIRYATAARFAAPQPVAPWTGVRDAVERGPVSPQLPARVAPVTGPSPDDRSGTARQDEDCLRVDVRAPAAALTDGVPRPVLVWLHGGAYVIGSATTSWYDTSRLVAEGDVVTVSVGYRLGILGWLAAPGVSDGNLGLLDQLAALRWVHEHGAAFGGDPDQVTLMGHSAGAHSIACLMTVPEARPLFRRVILQSGQLGLGLSSPDRAARVARYVAEGLDGADPRTADVAALLAAQRHAMIRAAGPGGLDSSPAFAPTDGVPPLSPGVSWTDAAAAGHDVLVGSTADEAETFARISPVLWGLRRLPVLGRVTSAGVNVATRRVFGAPAERFADDAARSGARTHSYRFAWRAPASRLGACHCIELPFLFGARDAWEGAPMLGGADWDVDVEPLGAVLRGAWLQFVRTGNPWTDALPWPPHSPGRGPTVVLDRETERRGARSPDARTVSTPRNGHTR
ncbi:carboxylesterase/lipase family protein [Actinomycetospora cinnamomea]|uniref:Carboxylic ester hydrolase n=1 Tax=Actinomycetospora cinnamomea TaxID=663609 RepID=A0A2U1F681_9PSEU|nr:carboxylesterase family protein [Actinomycetospora cinnamomea]PVZ07686.1 carboxylesterase type B [Actinomycetospora cinnamomea]